MKHAPDSQDESGHPGEQLWETGTVRENLKNDSEYVLQRVTAQMIHTDKEQERITGHVW